MHRKNVIIAIVGVNGDGWRRISGGMVRGGALALAGLVHVFLFGSVVDRNVPAHSF